MRNEAVLGFFGSRRCAPRRRSREKSFENVEVFATLTGGRLGFRYRPDDAAALIKEITFGMSFVDLAPAETIEALETAEKRGVRGGRVHDWLHACAARKCGATELLTDNTADFAGLTEGLAVVTP
jgi:hypothetical protein